MYIQITTDGSLTLEEKNDMKRFSIVETHSASGMGTARLALINIARPAEDNHYWIDAHAVIALSGQDANSQWVAEFWKMLAAVEPYGYFDKEAGRVKAHVESA